MSKCRGEESVFDAQPWICCGRAAPQRIEFEGLQCCFRSTKLRVFLLGKRDRYVWAAISGCRRECIFPVPKFHSPTRLCAWTVFKVRVQKATWTIGEYSSSRLRVSRSVVWGRAILCWGCNARGAFSLIVVTIHMFRHDSKLNGMWRLD